MRFVPVALVALSLLAVSPALADEAALRVAIESYGAAVVQKQKPVQISGKGRSWANVTPLKVEKAGEALHYGFWLYLQDTKVEGSGSLLTGNKTDAAGIYTASAYIDSNEAPDLVAYLTGTIARFRALQSADGGLVSYTYNGREDFSLELAVDGKKQELSIYSSGKLLRGQSFAVANRQLKVTLNGIEEFEKLRDALQGGLNWFRETK